MRQSIFAEISAEREKQEEGYGYLDATNTPYNWSAYIGQYSTRHLIGDPSKVDAQQFRADMVKVAALAVAAIEAIDLAR